MEYRVENKQDRIPLILEKLLKAWLLEPDWRLGQFISNLMGTGRQDVFFTDDVEWESLLDKFIKEHED